MSVRNYFGGLSGIKLPTAKFDFPEEYRERSRLEYYSTFFNSIEVNSSFYSVPRPSTVRRWAASVGDEFRFTFKLPKDITHCKDFHFEEEELERFLISIQEARPKNGCVLIQLPPSRTVSDLQQLDRLLYSISVADGGHQWKIAVEFRNRSWYIPDVFDLLTSYNASLVIHDMPKSAAPFLCTSDQFVYCRFHGPTGNYSGSYADAVLAEYVSYAREWIDEGKDVYLYFNNTKGEAFANLNTLNRLILQN